jgi:chromosome segregation ATPase
VQERNAVKRAVAIAIATAALALPGPAWAADDPPSDEAAYQAQKEMWQGRFQAAREAVATQRARRQEYQAQKEMWQGRFQAAREAVATQRARRQEALDAYKQMRHRRRQRGEEKQQILEELTAAEVALEESESALEELYESARRAGVPPGWTRMQRGDSPAAPGEERAQP